MKMAEKNEIEEDEEIADNRNWIDSDICTLLEVMEVMLPKFAVPSLWKATLWKKVIQQLFFHYKGTHVNYSYFSGVNDDERKGS